MRNHFGALVVLLLTAGCGVAEPAPPAAPPAASSDAATAVSPPASSSSASTAPEVTGGITVLAAASLTDVFTAIAQQVEAEHPGTSVTLSFAASSELVAQVQAGAPADVLATANTQTMSSVVDAGLATGPEVFAANQLQIAVPRGNPGDVDGLDDLAAGASPDRLVALCAAQVPCGKAADQAFAAAGLTSGADTLEQDVRAVLTKVALGEVDAGLVYRSDVVSAADDVEGVDFPEAAGTATQDPIVVLRDAKNPGLAAVFVEAVTGAAGQQLLADAGFGAPSSNP